MVMSSRRRCSVKGDDAHAQYDVCCALALLLLKTADT